MFELIAAALLILAGGGDPLESALAYHDTMETTVQVSEAQARAEARAAAAAERARVEGATSTSRSKWSSAYLSPTLLCVRAAESGGDYQAFNGIEHYGAYQLSSTYSDDWARRYGHPEVAHLTADQWPPATQDAVAAALFADSPTLWSTYDDCR
jgi:hypothetical protein